MNLEFNLRFTWGLDSLLDEIDNSWILIIRKNTLPWFWSII